MKDAKATRLWVLGSDMSKTRPFYFPQLPSTCLNMRISDGEGKCLAFLEKMVALASSSFLALLTFLSSKLLPWQGRDIGLSGHFALSQKVGFVD